MGFADTLGQQPKRQAGTRCGVAVTLAQMEPDDAAALTEALADHTIDASRISRALRAEGFDVSDQTVRRHRTGCGCHSAKR
jgi:hypothetical protein